MHSLTPINVALASWQGHCEPTGPAMAIAATELDNPGRAIAAMLSCPGLQRKWALRAEQDREEIREWCEKKRAEMKKERAK